MAEWTPWDELEAERKERWAAEAQRDRAVELLRQAKAEADKHTGSGVPGDEPYCCCALCELVGDIGLDDFLAKQKPCQRCGDEGWIDTDEYKPCLDCQGGAS